MRTSTDLDKALIFFAFDEDDIPKEIFTTRGNILAFGVVPARVDLINEIDGVSFEETRPNTVRGKYGNIEVTFIGLKDLLENKKSTPRARDRADIEELSQE